MEKEKICKFKNMKISGNFVYIQDATRSNFVSAGFIIIHPNLLKERLNVIASKHLRKGNLNHFYYNKNENYYFIIMEHFELDQLPKIISAYCECQACAQKLVLLHI